MTFFGWGKKRLHWLIINGDKQIAIFCLYSYFSINFLPIVTGSTWYEQDLDQENVEEVSYDSLVEKFGVNTPKLGWYRSYALLVIPLFIALIYMILISIIFAIYPLIKLN